MLLKFSRLLTDMSPATLPDAAMERARVLLLNFVGGGLPGADAGVSLAELRMWSAMGGEGSCVILGRRGRFAPLAAAAVNACMGQVFLEEDCHEATVSHPGVIVIPAALAVGQAVRSSGAAVLAAIAAGYECMGRIGRCLAKKGFSDYGLRPAAILGPFGAACAAAKLLGLDAEGLRNALSIAGNTAAGYMEFTSAGTDDICLQNCYAAKNGVMAAYEARAGTRGAPTILEGRFGLGRALNHGADCDWSRLTAPAPAPEIMDTFIKSFPGCGHVLPTAQAVTQIMATRAPDPGAVRRAVVGTHTGGKNYPGCDNKGPFTGPISAMTSHQFMVAAGIVLGAVNTRAVQAFAREDVNAFASQVEVVLDQEIDALPGSGGRLTLELTTGERIESLQRETEGLSDAGVVQRLRENAEGFYSEARVEALLDAASKLKEMDDICAFADLLESDLR